MSGGPRSLIGGHLELSANSQLYVLSSVTGTSRMAAYVTVIHIHLGIGMCFAVGGEGFQVGLFVFEAVAVCHRDG